MRAGDVVVIAAFDEVPEHLFRIDEVLDDCVTGVALSGPLVPRLRASPDGWKLVLDQQIKNQLRIAGI